MTEAGREGGDLQGAPLALRLAKEAVNQGVEADLQTGLKLEESLYAQVWPPGQSFLTLHLHLVPALCTCTLYLHFASALCIGTGEKLLPDFGLPYSAVPSRFEPPREERD